MSEDVSKYHKLEGSDYVSTRNLTFEDSVKAYLDLDKWILTLTGAAIALVVTVIKDSDSITLLHVSGLFFVGSICLAMLSKKYVYKESVLSLDLIEKVWQESADNFDIAYHNASTPLLKRCNKKCQKLDETSFWFFIIGMLMLTVSFAWTGVSNTRGQHECKTDGAPAAYASPAASGEK